MNDLCAHYDCKNLDITHIVTYITFHAKKIAGECKNMETLWKSGKFLEFGKKVTELV